MSGRSRWTAEPMGKVCSGLAHLWPGLGGKTMKMSVCLGNPRVDLDSGKYTSPDRAAKCCYWLLASDSLASVLPLPGYKGRQNSTASFATWLGSWGQGIGAHSRGWPKTPCTIPVPGNSLIVQWLRLHAPNAGGPGSIPGQRTRSHMPPTKDPVCRDENPACLN